jgi:hypothetical protein
MLNLTISNNVLGHMVVQLLEAHHYKLDGHKFKSKMQSLKFFIHVILPAALWPWDQRK